MCMSCIMEHTQINHPLKKVEKMKYNSKLFVRKAFKVEWPMLVSGIYWILWFKFHLEDFGKFFNFKFFTKILRKIVKYDKCANIKIKKSLHMQNICRASLKTFSNNKIFKKSIYFQISISDEAQNWALIAIKRQESSIEVQNWERTTQKIPYHKYPTSPTKLLIISTKIKESQIPTQWHLDWQAQIKCSVLHKVNPNPIIKNSQHKKKILKIYKFNSKIWQKKMSRISERKKIRV